MNCLNNLVRTQIPNDVLMSTLKLYLELGKNDYYKSLFAPDLDVFSHQVASLDAYYFFKCFFPEEKISDPRMKTLQLDSTVARTKAESLYKNIIAIFSLIHQPKAQPFKLNVTEIHDLVRLLFKEYYTNDQINYQKLENSKRASLLSMESSSKREALERLINLYGEIKKKNEYEELFLCVNFMVDFLNMEIYKFKENDLVAFLIYYILSGQEQLLANKYVSFFGKLYFHIKEYQIALDRTRFNWKEGYAEIMPMQRLLLKIYQDMYAELSDHARDYEYESKLEISKSDYVENTIDKLNDVFSKEDIRLKHPLISDSTINRTLQRMQAENKIRPLGKGRSAKWIKLYKKESRKVILEQLNLDLGGK